MPDPFKAVEDGLLLFCRVNPGASQNRIAGLITDDAGQTYIKVLVSVPPEKGKANQALIKLISKSLGLPKSSIEVISGHTSRIKTLKITGAGREGSEKVKRLLGSGP